jgi:protease-4
MFGLIGLTSRGGSKEGGPRVALVRVSGIITGGEGGGSPLGGGGGAASEAIIKALDAAADDGDVKAIVVRINSPGGSPAGSQEVYDEIRRLKREKKKPIVVSMGDVAASGGYFIASAADRIFANGSTMTASIGVIMEYPVLAGLFQKYGVNMTVIKSGKFKDIGNIGRQLTPEERVLLQTLIMDVYGQFVTAVVNGRKLPRAQVLKIADGRVMSGAQALKYKLVDEIGGLRAAVAYAGKQGGIKGEPKVKEVGRKGLFQSLFGDSDADSSFSAADAVRTLRLLADPRVQAALRGLASSSPPQPGLR